MDSEKWKEERLHTTQDLVILWKELGFYSERDGKHLEGLEQKPDVIHLHFFKDYHCDSCEENNERGWEKK